MPQRIKKTVEDLIGDNKRPAPASSGGCCVTKIEALRLMGVCCATVRV